MNFHEHIAYVEISSALINSYEWHKLQPDKALQAFEDAVNGLPSPLSKYVRGTGARLSRYEWSKLRKKIFDRDGYICAYCGVKDVKFHIDHIIPISRGGRNELANLCVACQPCNHSKYNKTLEEWLS